jgi:hypothetical protein
MHKQNLSLFWCLLTVGLAAPSVHSQNLAGRWVLRSNLDRSFVSSVLRIKQEANKLSVKATKFTPPFPGNSLPPILYATFVYRTDKEQLLSIAYYRTCPTIDTLCRPNEQPILYRARTSWITDGMRVELYGDRGSDKNRLVMTQHWRLRDGGKLLVREDVTCQRPLMEKKPPSTNSAVDCTGTRISYVFERDES